MAIRDHIGHLGQVESQEVEVVLLVSFSKGKTLKKRVIISMTPLQKEENISGSDKVIMLTLISGTRYLECCLATTCCMAMVNVVASASSSFTAMVIMVVVSAGNPATIASPAILPTIIESMCCREKDQLEYIQVCGLQNLQ